MKCFALLIAIALPTTATAHDTWVQTNTNLVRVGDSVHVDLMLGNHGNEHRDFKLAGKLALDGATLALLDPDGRRYDLLERLADTGYTPQEGYWTARFDTAKPGAYVVAHTLDRVMTYAPERAIKSAKTVFVAARSLDRPNPENPGFDRVLGHDLELVPITNPVTPMGPGTPIKVRLILQGQAAGRAPRGVHPSRRNPRFRHRRAVRADHRRRRRGEL